MLKQSLKLWHFWLVEPFNWLRLEWGDLDETLPEKMERPRYILNLVRLALPFYVVAYLLALIALPIFSVWNGETIPSPFPFAKLAMWCAICEVIALGIGAFGRTRFTFLLTIGLGLPLTIGLGAGMAIL
jgi:hypothetical protein